MATDITVNATKSVLSIAVDKTDYPSGLYPDFIDIAVSNLDMHKGETTAPLIINGYLFDTANGTINVSAVAAATNTALRAAILAAV